MSILNRLLDLIYIFFYPGIIKTTIFYFYKSQDLGDLNIIGGKFHIKLETVA